ncbi:MAG: RICIN domain-containing protein [Clostridia bacterium]|nr:RICIN domain-containing protein [Clostridia bacterium]MBR5767215.1 RICIN domain-containing protein [Clostridia bacterium]
MAANAIIQSNLLTTNSYEYRWTFTLGSDGYYSIQSQDSGLYMRVKNNSASSGANVIQSTASYTGAKWALMKSSATSDFNYVFVPKSSTSSLVVLKSNGSYLKTVTYTNNSTYDDEWRLVSMCPTTGSEITYGSDDWSSDGNGHYNNCYAYALNNQVHPGTNNFWDMQQPGEYYGSMFTACTKAAIELAVNNDYSAYRNTHAGTYVFTEVQHGTLGAAGTYKVALVVGYGYISNMLVYDYHWYRQDADGFWSHKPGQTAVTRFDSDGNLIVDPAEAGRNYLSSNGANYNTFCGYYQITPWNNLYIRSKDFVKNDTDVVLSMFSSVY